MSPRAAVLGSPRGLKEKVAMFKMCLSKLEEDIAVSSSKFKSVNNIQPEWIQSQSVELKCFLLL